MRFEPVYFSAYHKSIGKPNHRDPLELAPVGGSVSLRKKSAALHRRPRSDCFDITDLTDDFDFVFHRLKILLQGEPWRAGQVGAESPYLPGAVPLHPRLPYNR